MIVRNLTIAKRAERLRRDHHPVGQQRLGRPLRYFERSDLAKGYLRRVGRHHPRVAKRHGLLEPFSRPLRHGVSLVGHTDTPNPTDGDRGSCPRPSRSTTTSTRTSWRGRRVPASATFTCSTTTTTRSRCRRIQPHRLMRLRRRTERHCCIESNVFEQVAVPIVTFLNDPSVYHWHGQRRHQTNLYVAGSSLSANIITPFNNWKPPISITAPVDPPGTVPASSAPAPVPATSPRTIAPRRRRARPRTCGPTRGRVAWSRSVSRRSWKTARWKTTPPSRSSRSARLRASASSPPTRA